LNQYQHWISSYHNLIHFSNTKIVKINHTKISGYSTVSNIFVSAQTLKECCSKMIFLISWK
jgi:hypothetical protein